MSIVAGVLAEELERQKANENSYRGLLLKLPKGSLYCRQIRGHSYLYRDSRQGKNVHSIDIGPAGSPEADQARSDFKEYHRIRATLKRCLAAQLRLCKPLKPHEKQ